MERLILARHGESEYSARGLVNGDAAVTVGLTETGAEQARRLGELLADEPLDLCVTSRLGRTRLTAELALAGRDVPAEAWGDLDDPRAGAFEGLHLDEYRAWAWTSGSGIDAPGGGESRLTAVARYARGFRALLERTEPAILAVLHALPIAYVLGALEGEAPAARMDRPVAYAHPFLFSAAELERALGVLEVWIRQPTW
jgi:broad specificity phosphatase PhoE